MVYLFVSFFRITQLQEYWMEEELEAPKENESEADIASLDCSYGSL